MPHEIPYRISAYGAFAYPLSGKAHVCDICSKNFKERSDLLNHMPTHLGEKAHICDICSQKFTERSDLLKHLPTHLGMKAH